jgi:hypothetical protein
MKPVRARNRNEEQVVCMLMNDGHLYIVKGGHGHGEC